MKCPGKFGPYILLRRLAVGGMAEIYLAKVAGLAGFEKHLVLKLIHPKFAADPEFIDMLVSEAKLAVLLSHGNIAQVFDLGVYEDRYYIAMEYVDGLDLFQLLRRLRDARVYMPFEVATYIISEVCSGFDYAHNRRDEDNQPLGIIHRDISPQNVLVSWDGDVKIIDFGIAKARARSNTTAVGVIKGKFFYMSPEQARGEQLDHRSDIFSVGVLFYELLTNRMIYDTESMLDALRLAKQATFLPPSSHREDLPAELERIAMKALSRNALQRYQSANEMRAALTAWLRRAAPGFGRHRLEHHLGEVGRSENRTTAPHDSTPPLAASQRQLAAPLSLPGTGYGEHVDSDEISSRDGDDETRELRPEAATRAAIRHGVANPIRVDNDDTGESGPVISRGYRDTDELEAMPTIDLHGPPTVAMYDIEDRLDGLMDYDPDLGAADDRTTLPEGERRTRPVQALPADSLDLDVTPQDRPGVRHVKDGTNRAAAAALFEKVREEFRQGKSPHSVSGNDYVRPSDDTPLERPAVLPRRTLKKSVSPDLLARSRPASTPPPVDGDWGEPIRPLKSRPIEEPVWSTPGAMEALAEDSLPVPMDSSYPEDFTPTEIGPPPRRPDPVLVPAPSEDWASQTWPEPAPSKRPMRRRRRHRWSAILFVLALFAVAAAVRAYMLSSEPEVIQSGTLFVTSRPPGAEILLNGNPVGGTTPSLLSNLAAGGEHEVSALLTGYRMSSETVIIEGGSEIRVSLTLIPIRYRAQLESSPTGAAIMVNGQRVGTTPTTLQDIRLRGTLSTNLVLRYQGRPDTPVTLTWPEGETFIQETVTLAE